MQRFIILFLILPPFNVLTGTTVTTKHPLGDTGHTFPKYSATVQAAFDDEYI
jgi:hypothetical protein